MLTRARRRCGRKGEDGGFTIVEMTVVMMLSTMLLFIVGRGFLQNFRTMGQAQSRSEVTVRIQNALEVISRDIRVADPLAAVPPTSAIVSGTATTLTVNVVRANQCSQRTWSLTAPTI